ncbi:MAG: cytochrome c [Rhodobacteraceae bacterium]|nr:cytochrome c [Paracoccaceae bacterium]
MISVRLAAVTALALAPALVSAQDYKFQLTARQGQMAIAGIGASVLGDMAKGKIAYDAAAAEAAAHNIAAIASLNQDGLWPEGSDDMSIDGTRAQPTIWENNADFMSKWESFQTAALSLSDAAGSGVEAMQPALNTLGQACVACHKAHRAPEN